MIRPIEVRGGGTMKRTTKTLSFEAWIADAVQERAEKERRSFTGEVEVLLRTALARANFRDPDAPARRPLSENLEVRT
jgi:hypothetical protein